MILYLYVPVTVVISASFTLVVGLNCDSGCGDCWKDGSATGEDTKFLCPYGKSHKRKLNCGTACPAGYHGMDCAKWERC